MHLDSCLWRPATGWAPALPAERDTPRTLVLAFGAANLEPSALQELAKAFPQSVVVGCSTAGEIHRGELHDDSISLAVATFEHTRLRSLYLPVDEPGASAAAGEALARGLAGDDLRAVFVLGDGVTVNGAALVAGLTQALPAGVAVSGGLAADGDRFRRTWLLCGGQVRTAHVLAVGLYGRHLQVQTGCEGGWQDFGPSRRITRAQGAVLHELDGKPALELYRHYLGDRAAELPAAALRFPLSIHPPGQAEQPTVRTILGIDDASRSMTFAGDMPSGWEARLMRSSPDRLIDSAAAAARQSLHDDGGCGPALVVSVSCVGRRLVLGERTEEEIEGTLDGAPPGSVHVGFYAYGELAPAPGEGGCRLYNQTMTITAFREARPVPDAMGAAAA